MNSKKCQAFCVPAIMKSKIVNYLTVQLISDKSFKVHYAQRIRSAWILAEKKYAKMTHEEKQKILKKLKEKGEE
jgi:hypothetical protein